MISPGQIARRLLGKHFIPLGNIYRRIFVDLERVVDVFEHELPENARVLDIGGGDGALVDRLLNRRPDLSVTMCDLAPSIGAFLSEPNRTKVNLHPATEFSAMTGPFDAVTIADVLHHVPVDQRGRFFEELHLACERWDTRKLILKDVEPGGWRALMAVLTDRYITGDKHVVPFSKACFAQQVRLRFKGATHQSKMPDWPNYCEVLSW